MKPDCEDRKDSECAPIRILIVDDHPAVRKGLALLLEPEGIEVCAEAHSAGEALSLADAHSPDLALVDLSLGSGNGLALIEEFVRRGLPSLAYSMHEDGRSIQRVFAAGGHGYVTKRETHDVLIAAIGEVAENRRFVSPRAALALADQIAKKSAEADAGDLSMQEREVYRMMGSGESTRTIAAAMNISRHTVETYYARIRQKLNVESMADLRRHASQANRNASL